MADASMETAGAAVPGTERRVRSDRRRLSWRTFVHGSLTPRRRSHRRDHESDSLVDWHEPHLLFLAIVILLLSVTDAFLTLRLIELGAHEANPIMAWVLEKAPRLFAVTKMALTGIGLIVLIALARARIFRVIRTSIVIHWCMLAYVALIVYEASLLRQVL